MNTKTKGFYSGSSAPATLSDSWEVLNAKLQYEKYLQELKDKGIDPSVLHAPRRALNNDQAYSMDSSVLPLPPHVNESECGTPDISTPRATPVLSIRHTSSGCGSAAIRPDQHQTEIRDASHPAPAAWSPSFTRKHYRNGGLSKSSLRSKSESQIDGDESKGSRSKVPKSVCIKVQNETLTQNQATFRHSNNFLTSAGTSSTGSAAAVNATSSATGGAACGVAATNPPPGNADNIFAGINGSIGVYTDFALYFVL